MVQQIIALLHERDVWIACIEDADSRARHVPAVIRLDG